MCRFGFSARITLSPRNSACLRAGICFADAMPDTSPPAPASPSAGSSKRRTFFIRLASTLGLWVVLTVALMMGLDWLLMVLVVLFGLGTSAEYFRLEKSDVQAGPYRCLGLGLCIAYWVAVGV